MRRARRLATNSEYSLSEIERNTPIPPERVRVIHHGVPDPFGEEPGAKEREALTVGAIDHTTLVQKGQLPFVEAAKRLPDVRFTFAGKWLDDSVERAARPRGRRTSTSPAGSRTRTSTRPTGAPRSTCRRRATRASGSRWPRRCWPAACRW